MVTSRYRGIRGRPVQRSEPNDDSSTLQPNSILKTVSHRINYDAATATGKFGLPKIITDEANMERGEKTIHDVREWV